MVNRFRIRGSPWGVPLLIVCERGGAGSTGSEGSAGSGAFRHPEWRKTSYVKETLILNADSIAESDFIWIFIHSVVDILLK